MQTLRLHPDKCNKIVTIRLLHHVHPVTGPHPRDNHCLRFIQVFNTIQFHSRVPSIVHQLLLTSTPSNTSVAVPAIFRPSVASSTFSWISGSRAFSSSISFLSSGSSSVVAALSISSVSFSAGQIGFVSVLICNVSGTAFSRVLHTALHLGK